MEAQNTCEMGFITDSLYIEKDNTFIQSDGLKTPVLKNEGQVKLFKVGNKKICHISILKCAHFYKVLRLYESLKTKYRLLYSIILLSVFASLYTTCKYFFVILRFISILTYD